MAEGNAGVYDFDAIRQALKDRGYRPVWHTEATARAEGCPAEGTCPIQCRDTVNGGFVEGAPLNCRLRSL